MLILYLAEKYFPQIGFSCNSFFFFWGRRGLKESHSSMPVWTAVLYPLFSVIKRPCTAGWCLVLCNQIAERNHWTGASAAGDWQHMSAAGRRRRWMTIRGRLEAAEPLQHTVHCTATWRVELRVGYFSPRPKGMRYKDSEICKIAAVPSQKLTGMFMFYLWRQGIIFLVHRIFQFLTLFHYLKYCSPIAFKKIFKMEDFFTQFMQQFSAVVGYQVVFSLGTFYNHLCLVSSLSWKKSREVI